MRALRVLSTAFASLLLAAHALRSGSPVVAVALAALPLLLTVRGGWAVRVVQVTLVVGAFEWLLTLLRLVSARRAAGMPSARLAAILVGVIVLTALAAWLLQGWRRQPGERARGAAAVEAA